MSLTDDLKERTSSELRKIAGFISLELEERRKEDTKTVYLISLNGEPNQYYKNFEDALEEFHEEAEFTVKDCENTFSLSSVKIPVPDYHKNPNTWIA